MPGGDRRSRNLRHLECKRRLIQPGVHVLGHARLPMESSKWRRSWRSMAPSSNITTKVISDNPTLARHQAPAAQASGFTASGSGVPFGKIDKALIPILMILTKLNSYDSILVY
jgi:hypothetical protein